jgi:hypothetical protein
MAVEDLFKLSKKVKGNDGKQINEDIIDDWDPD